MLFGTKLHFRIAYFFTAFFPSILILLLKIGDSKKMFFWIMLIIFLSVSFISARCIIKELKTRQSNSKYSSTNIVINFDVQKKRLKHGYVIQVQNNSKVNPGFIPFATSILFPSIIVDNNKIYVPLIIMIFFFIILMFSNEVFPNIFLLLSGVNLLVTSDGYKIFYFSKDKDTLTGTKIINSIGNTGSLSMTYIITNQEYDGKELKNIDDD